MYSSLLTLCVFGDLFNLQHALSCPKGRLVITRHNELRNLTAAFNPLVRCHLHHSFPAVHKNNESEKKREYDQRILHVEHG